MADVKISELTEISAPSTSDLLAIVTDTGGGVLGTRKITWDNLFYDGLVTTDKLGAAAVTATKIASGAVTENHINSTAIGNGLTGGSGSKIALASPYDVVHVIVLEEDEDLTLVDDLIAVPVPDTQDGKNIVRLMAWLSGSASSSGDVTIRFYNETDVVTIGTITIPAGSLFGTTTVITNPALAENDIVRIDCTGAGTGAKGLHVQWKVNIS
jgi:hypothetical protein